MEHVVLLQNEEDKGNDITIFTKLKSLHLHSLRNLMSICRGIESIEFPLLVEMEISGCEKMRCLVSSKDDENKSEEHYGDHDSLHLFCQPKVSFGNLQKLTLTTNRESKNVWCNQVPIGFFTGLVELHIGEYKKIRSLFSSSKIPQDHVNLQKLNIEWCSEMVKVIEDEELSSCDHPIKHTTPLFPSLTDLTLYNLSKLESFCEWRCADLELPSLTKLKIDKCDEMKSFNATAGSLIITPALQTVAINHQDLESVDDLNATLHQHFQKAKSNIFKKRIILNGTEGVYNTVITSIKLNGEREECMGCTS